MTDLHNHLLTFINDELIQGGQASPVGADDELLQSGVVDSLGIMRLVNFIAERFGHTVAAEDITIEHFSSVNTIAEYLQPRLGAVDAGGNPMKASS